MQQRQLRLGDILDDYCPRERRVTNHAVVAMVGEEVKQTRCTTCDAEHVFKHARVPRQRRKSDTPAALYSQVLAGGPKRVAPEPVQPPADEPIDTAMAAPDAAAVEPASPPGAASAAEGVATTPADADAPVDGDSDEESARDAEQGPAHRRLIRATLPRVEGQAPPARPAPEFTIRQPAGRQGRFRPRHQREPSPFHSGPSGHHPGHHGGGGMSRQGGRPPVMSDPGKRHGHGGGRKRSK